MKKLFFVLSTFLVNSIYAQCDGLRYESFVFDSVTVTSDVIYGSNTNIFEFEEELGLDVYEPYDDSLNLRPLIIFAHGGAFILGDKADPQMVLIGSDYARMGYVTASINYRLGFTQNPLIDQPDSADALATVVRATHDLRAAVRYFRKDVVENDNQFGIDTNNIFLAGFSAGGFMVLHHAYLDTEEEWPTFEPEVIGVDGGIEGNSGSPGYSSAFKAGLNVAGAIGDTAWIQAGDEPLMSTHGTDDEIVPYGDDTLSFSVGPINIDIARVFGSSVIHTRMDEMMIDNCFFSWEGQGHVPESELGPYYDTTFVRSKNFFASFVCGEEFNCDYEDIVSSVADLADKGLNIKVYPNPFDQFLILEGLEKYKAMNIRLIDRQGRIIYQWNDPASNRLDLSFVESGFYILQMTTGRNVRSVKLTKP